MQREATAAMGRLFSDDGAPVGVNIDTGGECTRGAARTEFFVW